jgi:hypothetical protein
VPLTWHVAWSPAPAYLFLRSVMTDTAMTWPPDQRTGGRSAGGTGPVPPRITGDSQQDMRRPNVPNGARHDGPQPPPELRGPSASRELHEVILAILRGRRTPAGPACSVRGVETVGTVTAVERGPPTPATRPERSVAHDILRAGVYSPFTRTRATLYPSGRSARRAHRQNGDRHGHS